MKAEMNRPGRLKHILLRFSEELPRRGTFGTAFFAFSSLRKRIFITNKARWYRLCLDEFAAPKDITSDLNFGFMSFDEASDFFRKNHESFPWMFFDEELEAARSAGHVFPCLRDEDTVVGYIKLGIGKVFVLDFGRILNIPPTTAFIYDTFIMPSHRGEGAGSLLINMTAAFAREEGFRNLWCHIPQWNIPSRKAFGKSEFKPVGEIRFTKLFGKELMWKHPRDFPLFRSNGGEESGELRLSEAPGR